MTSRDIFIVLGSILLVGVVVWFGFRSTDPILSVSNEEDTSVRAFVQDFGSRFKQVSLLSDDVSQEIGKYYGMYASPELIKKWQDRTEPAPGRHSSSLWPESVDVVSVMPQAPGVYRVEANVIEVVSGPGKPEPAAVYPISLVVEKRGDTWIIVSLTKGAYSQLPQRISVVGFSECLPHKDTSGPQTLECAFGIAIDQSDGHYAIDTSLMSTYPVDFPTGTKVRVQGIMTPANQLSSIQKYDIDGIIRATSIEKI